MELAAVHELDPLAELPLFKAVFVGDVKMLVQDLEGTDAVDAVNGGKEVLLVLKLGFAVHVLEEGREVEVVFREHDPHRLHPAGDELGFLHPLVLDLHDLVVADGLADLPEAVEQALAMVGRDVVKAFVGHQALDDGFVLFGDAAVDETVQQGHHLVCDHRAALQKDLADGQDLAVAQLLLGVVDQPVAPAALVVDDVLRQFLLCKKTSQGLDVTLDASLGHMKLLGQVGFVQNGTADQAGINGQHAVCFGLRETLIVHVTLPLLI